MDDLGTEQRARNRHESLSEEGAAEKKPLTTRNVVTLPAGPVGQTGNGVTPNV